MADTFTSFFLFMFSHPIAATPKNRFSFFLLFFFYTLFSLQGQTPDSLPLRTVVIQATRAGDRSPVPHHNLRAAAIGQVHQAQDVPYLLSGIPSVVESSDAGTGIGYTGMRIRGSDPTRVNVTINGIPLNDAESQGVFWVNLPDLASSAAEIQVQRGVGSSTNGAGAFGATVNIDLSKVVAEPSASVSSTLGSFGTRKYNALFGSGLLHGKWAFSGRVSGVQSEGYIDRAAADLFSFHLSGAYVGQKQSLQAHLLSGREVTYQAWNGVPAQYLDDPVLRRFNTAGTEKTGTPYDNEVDNYHQRHYMLLYKRYINRSLDLQLNGHYTRGYGYFEQYKADQEAARYGLPFWSSLDSNAERGTDLIRRRWLDNHFYGLTYALRWRPGAGGTEWLLGGGWHRYEGRHFGEIIWAQNAQTEKDQLYYDNDALKTDGNVFLKLEQPIGRAWSLFADMQLRAVSYRFLGYNNNLDRVDQTADLLFFNPKMGLHFQPDPHTAWYVFAGIGHREPNRDDYTQSSPESRPRAERMLDVEGGWKWNKGRWTAQSNLFYMYYRNQLVLDGRINDVGAYIRTNVPVSYRAGWEHEMRWQSTQRWHWAGNIALSINRVRDFTEYRDNWDTGAQDPFRYRNTPLAFSPGAIGRLESGYALLAPGKAHQLQLTLAAKYVSAQYLDNTGNEATRLPAFAYADMRLNYGWKTPSGQQLDVIVAVLNLLDARYENNGWVYRYTSAGYDARPDDPYVRAEGAGVYHQAGFFPQAGRQVMATVRVGF